MMASTSDKELDELQQEVVNLHDSLSEDDDDHRDRTSIHDHSDQLSTHSAGMAGEQVDINTASSAVMASGQQQPLGPLQARKRKSDHGLEVDMGGKLKRSRNHAEIDTLSVQADEVGLLSLGVPQQQDSHAGSHDHVSQQDTCSKDSDQLYAPMNVQYDEIELPSMSSHVKADSSDFSSEEKRISQEILDEINVSQEDPKTPYMKWTCSESTATFVNKVFRNPMLESHTKLVNLKTRLPDVEAMSWQNVDQYIMAAFKDPVSGRNTAQLNRVLAEDNKFKHSARQFVDAMGPVALVLDNINSGKALSYGQIALALKRSLTLCGTAMANINKQRRSNMLNGLNLRANFGHLTKKPPQSGTNLFGEAFLGHVKVQHEATKAFTTIVRAARPKHGQSRPHTVSRPPNSAIPQANTQTAGNPKFPTNRSTPFRGRSHMHHQSHSHGGQGPDVAISTSAAKPAPTQYPRDRPRGRGRGFNHNQGNRNK